MILKLNDLLELLPDAAAVIQNGAVTAANTEAIRRFISSGDNPVVLEISECEIEIDGISYRFAAKLIDDAELYVAANQEKSENPYSNLLKNINSYLREELGVAKASLGLLGNKIHAENGADPADEEEIKKYFYILRRSQSKLHRLADNLTDAFDDENTKLVTQVIDLAELCENLVSSVCSIIEMPGITVSFSRHPELESCITMADPVKLERMLLNIISNSVKNAPESGCSIKMTLASSNGNLIITVSDSKNGSPMELDESIFNSYINAKPLSKHNLGIGMSAALHVARQHGGNIIAVMHENGAAFSITIPLVEPPAKFNDYADFIFDDSMTRILTGLADIVSWNKFGPPFMDAEN